MKYQNVVELNWTIVCPDGKVRHYDYPIRKHALEDALRCDEDCRSIHKNLNALQKFNPPCPQSGKHRIRRSGRRL